MVSESRADAIGDAVKLRVTLTRLAGARAEIVLQVVDDHCRGHFAEYMDECVEWTAVCKTPELPTNSEPTVHHAECIEPCLRV